MTRINTPVDTVVEHDPSLLDCENIAIQGEKVGDVHQGSRTFTQFFLGRLARFCRLNGSVVHFLHASTAMRILGEIADFMLYVGIVSWMWSIYILTTL